MFNSRGGRNSCWFAAVGERPLFLAGSHRLAEAVAVSGTQSCHTQVANEAWSTFLF